jgi:hypothetical protein
VTSLEERKNKYDESNIVSVHKKLERTLISHIGLVLAAEQ